MNKVDFVLAPLTVKQYAPRAVVRSGNNVLIDQNHPHAAELTEIARRLVENVELLGQDDSEGFKLIDRVAELAGLEAATVLQSERTDSLRRSMARKEKEDADRRAEAWLTRWRAWIAAKKAANTHGYEVDVDMVQALARRGELSMRCTGLSGNLIAVYAYAFQQGQKAAKEGKSELYMPDMPDAVSEATQ